MPRKNGPRPSGAGSLYWSDPQERWVASVTLGSDENGTRIRKVFVGPRGGKSEDDRLGVKDRLERFLRDRAPAGKQRITSRIGLGAYLRNWLEAKDLSEASRSGYGWAIENHLIPGLGNVKLHDLDRGKINQFFSKLKMGHASKVKVRAVLRAALEDAVNDGGQLAINPATNIKLPKRNEFSEVSVWSASEAKRFLKAVKGTEYFPLFLLALVGALGPAELFGIRWKDVDLARGAVAIVANLTEVDGRLILKETKTQARRRSVALPRIVLQVLKARYKGAKPKPTDFVFTAPEGGGIRRTTFRHRVWLPLLKEAKVPVITLYGLRHSSASLMAAMGVPILVASRALGHSNIRTTANTYTHLFEESQREVASKFDVFLKDL